MDLDEFYYVAKVKWLNEDEYLETSYIAISSNNYSDAAEKIENIYGPTLESMEITAVHENYMEISEEEYEKRRK